MKEVKKMRKNIHIEDPDGYTYVYTDTGKPIDPYIDIPIDSYLTEGEEEE